MTPEQMADLLNNYGTPDYGSNKSSDNRIRLRRYNVIVRTKENEVVETYEMVSMKVAREIRNEAHTENMVADIIEDWTITYSDREINPKPIENKPIPAPRHTAMNTPVYTEHQAEVRRERNLKKIQDNIARSHKNAPFQYHIFRIINKSLGIDIEDTQENIAEFLTGRTDVNDFKIIYCGVANSWGKEI